MDALALLCNLYGDGPATLKRLKSAGLPTVESLDDIEASGLAETLETTEAAARRFLREARLLGERMVESGFEEEAQPPIAHQAAAPVPPPIVELEPDFGAGVVAEHPPAMGGRAPERELEPDVGDDSTEAQTPFEDEVPEFEDDPELGVDPEQGEHEVLVENVLTTWRERDILVRGDWDGPVGTAGKHSDEGVRSGFDTSERGTPGSGQTGSGRTEESAPAAVSETPLELRLLDGLNAAWCQEFEDLGLSTLEDLAAMDTLSVAQQLGQGLTRLDRFRFLARRHLSQAQLESAPSAVLLPRAPQPSGASAPIDSPASAAPAPDKFSPSGQPFGVAHSPLARELDRIARVRELDAGSAGPFS